MSKKGMKLTGILQNHNQHPQSDQKYDPLRTNIRNSKQKPIHTQLTKVSHVSRKLQSLSPHQADLIKNTVHIPVNCGLRVTSNEEKQHQALQRRYVAINMYEKEGSKPISPNTFERLPKNQKYEVVYEYHCPNSEGKVEEYYSSDSMTQSKRVAGERQNYQLNDNGAVRNGVSGGGEQSGQQTIIRNTISPSSSSQVIRNNVSPSGQTGQTSGQTGQTKIVTQTIYGPVEGKPIEGAFLVNNVKNNTFASSTIKSESVIDYEVKSRIKSPESNIKGGASGIKGGNSAVNRQNSAVRGQTSGVQQNRGTFESEKRTEVISGSKGKNATQLQTIYGPRQGQPIGGSRVSIQHNRSLEGSTIKDRNSIYEHNTQNNHGATQSIKRTTLYQEEYRTSTDNRGSADKNSTGGISMTPIKVTTQREEINRSGRGDGSVKNTMSNNNYRDSNDQLNREANQNGQVSRQSIARNISGQQQDRKNSTSKQHIIYGPSEGKPIGEVAYRQSLVSNHEEQQSNLISSKVIQYDHTSNKANQQHQGIRANTSPATKIIQQQVNTSSAQQQQVTKKRPANQIPERSNISNKSSQQLVEYQAEYIGEGRNISMQPIKVTTKIQIKQNQSGKNGQSVTIVRESTTDMQQISNNTNINTNNRATFPIIQRNTSPNQQTIHGSNASKKAIYGPRQGQAINGATHHYGTIQGIDSTIVSSSRHNNMDYGQSSAQGNQGIRANMSPSTKVVREGTSPNGRQYQQQQQTGYYTHEEYRNGGSVGLIANGDNGYLDGPAYFETQGRMKYNQTGRNSINQNDITPKRQIQSGANNNTGTIQIGGRNKTHTRQTFQDFQSNIGINSRHNQKNMNSTREYSRRDVSSKEDMMVGNETEVKGQYRIDGEGGDAEESRQREYVQNVESRIIIGGNGEGRISGSQEDIGMIRGKNNKKVQVSNEQAEYQLKAQKQPFQTTRNQHQSPVDPHPSQPFPLHISTRPTNSPSTNPQLQQRKKKLSQYQQTGTKGYTFKKGSEEPETKRKKQEYKYNLYSMLDEQFNLKCATGLCVPNEICATAPKRDGWK